MCVCECECVCVAGCEFFGGYGSLDYVFIVPFQVPPTGNNMLEAIYCQLNLSSEQSTYFTLEMFRHFVVEIMWSLRSVSVA